MNIEYEWRTYSDNGQGFCPTISKWHKGLPEEENFGSWSTVQIREVAYCMGRCFIGNTWEFYHYEDFCRSF